ncbi:rod shape-determining protein MreD [Desulfosporosinus acidiphilus SJ4]|uniref:Rod shape-determining protein MreD n=1 Tax=Desulfosporosinus acidiphilus (strain DSM 22704 / JCM 16185 / SJ4) TaxID=646529 RepID=I4DBI2_DESAJ|nr:rod shape-determining protein MreD [Desulfosporosinus acidiphilus]AFM43156.1 rod shape-determining protein MreD [Desulfosporosinus acidiphilus SJ4]
MRYILITVMFLLSLILPGTLFHFWAWSGIKPDLLMLLTIYMAAHHRRLSSLLWGLGAGLLEDFYLGRYIGMYTLTLLVVAFLSNWLTERWYRENFLLTTFMVFIVTAVGQICVAFLALGAGLQWSMADIAQLVFGVALYNAVLVPITYPLIHRSFQYGWLRYRPRYER